MSDTVIRVERLGKSYRLRHQRQERYVALRDVLAERSRALGRRLLGRGSALPRGEGEEQFWALRDVSFNVRRGEILGIIGRNGAGKSTLLKILSRITEPTQGRVRIRGRVASLLEVGTGFHPELTGRENIFLNGAILGMPRAEIRAKFDEIVAFADVEKFLDTPVKRYSSGMYLRLAFAVAAHLEPEILLLDEVLAVGDAQFQKKCLGKMGDVARQGRTVLLVSHNLGVVSVLANRCIVLDQGRLAELGETPRAIRHYLESGSDSSQTYARASIREHPHARRIDVLTSENSSVHRSSEALRVRFEVEMPVAREGMCLSFQIINQYQQPAVHAWIYDPERPFCRAQGINIWECELPALSLNVGNYALRVFLSEPPGGRVFEVLENVCSFEVVQAATPPLFGYRPDACVYLAAFDWRPSP